MRCPFCQSDNLLTIEKTECCEDCGGSFEVVNPPQDVLLESVRSTDET
jgi:transposase-like protein